MSLLQEALTISLTGIAAVFLSLTLLVFVLFVLSKLLKPKIDPEIPEKEITNSKETISTSNHSDSVNPVAENSDKPPENPVLTPEDKELEEVAIIAAITLTIQKRTGGKRQSPSKQIYANKKDRVHLVSLDKG